MYVPYPQCTSSAWITLLRTSVPREVGTERVDCWGCASGIRKAIPIVQCTQRMNFDGNQFLYVGQRMF